MKNIDVFKFLLLCTTLCLGVGCVADDSSSARGAIRSAECQSQFDECIGSGGDPMSCHEAQTRCESEPIESCDEAFESCVAIGRDEMFCHEELLLCEEEGNSCEDAFESCLATGRDEMFCDDERSLCEGAEGFECDLDDNIRCNVEFCYCVARSEDSMSADAYAGCTEQKRECELARTPCEIQFDECIVAGGEVMACAEARALCEGDAGACQEADCGPKPPGLPCGDPVAGLECQSVGGGCAWVDTCPADGELCSPGACEDEPLPVCDEAGNSLPVLACVANERRCEWALGVCDGMS